MSNRFVYFLRIFAAALLVCTSLLIGTGSAHMRTAFAASEDTVRISGTCDYERAYEVLELVNKERAARGLSRLTMDKSLLNTAMLRSAETSVYWSHNRADNSTCFTASKKMYGENIAAGYSSMTAKAVMNMWMNSSGHKANILKDCYTTIGIGCFVHNNIVYWVQSFGIHKGTPVSRPSNKTAVYSITIADDKLTKNTLSTSASTGIALETGEKKQIKIYNSNQGWSAVSTLLGNTNFSWTTSNKSVASVSSGTVKAVSNGTAVISAAYRNNPKIKLSFKVSVTNKGAKQANAVVASASGTVMLSGIKYRIVKEGGAYTAKVIGLYKSMQTVKIPACIKNGGNTYKVTAIAANAFKNQSRIKKVIIGSNVQTIGYDAFYNCTGLSSVTLGNGIKAISSKVFYNCRALTAITIPSKVTTIGDRAFVGCVRLKTVKIKTAMLGTGSVGCNAFSSTPDSLTLYVPKGKAAAYKKLLINAGLDKSCCIYAF